jgi:ParB family chromosome partitioning protein
MTSGSFSSIPITKVWVDRASRQRRTLNNIPSLADSIRRLGLINPIVITRDFELKAGERRWEACKSLGWTNISAQWYDEVDATQLLLLELEENIKREDITWQEQCLAIDRYHHLRLAQDPAWTASKTANELGESTGGISQKLAVVQEMKNERSLVHQAPKLSTAINVTKRVAERRKQAALHKIAPQSEQQVPLVNADFLTYKFDEGVKFNFLHCDFPYGINQQDHNKQSSTPTVRYEDSFDVYKVLCERLEATPYADSAHLMFWFSMDHYCWTLDCLRRMGWRVDPFPLIWSRGNMGLLPDPQRGPRRVYETAFLGSRGDRKIVTPVGNLTSFWDSDRIHSSEKPRPVLEHFFKMLVDEYTVMLDPTCGSGNAVRVAEKLGAKYVLGIEKEREFYEEAKANYDKA